MKKYFRFLLNMDNCLNMAYYDMFFYKLSYEESFLRSDVQFLMDSRENSLHDGIMNVQMYMNKFPFQIGDFQIIAAFRMDYHTESKDWKDTLLYRLLWLRHELQKERIYIGSGERLETAESHVLSVIVLYEADLSTRTSDPKPYLREGSLEKHLKLMLLQEFGIDEEQAAGGDLSELLENGIREKAEKKEPLDPALHELLTGFLSDEEKKKDLRYFKTYINKQLQDFQIEEKLIDRNSIKNEVGVLLRLVEFIYPTEKTIDARDAENMSLSEYCKKLWESIWKDSKDSKLEKRYASMLYGYQKKLEYCLENYPRKTARDQENGREMPDISKVLLYEDKEPVRKIRCDEEKYRNFQVSAVDRKKETDKFDLNGMLQEYKASISRGGGEQLLKKWDEAYQRIRSNIDDLEQTLKLYSIDLSSRFIEAAEKRRKDGYLEDGRFTVSEDESRQIEVIANGFMQDSWKVLKQPQMLPSISFQDELNLRAKLEQCDSGLRFYTGCLKRVQRLPFLILVILIGGLLGIHYALLQPYVFTATTSMTVYLVYMCVAVVLMLASWSMPGRYFRKRMKELVEELSEALSVYIAGYYDRGYNFFVYLNTMNDLDIITAYLETLQSIRKEGEGWNEKIRWHREQIRRHLQKVQANSFQGLIKQAAPKGVKMASYDIKEDYWDTDCVRSRIYWPQD